MIGRLYLPSQEYSVVPSMEAGTYTDKYGPILKLQMRRKPDAFWMPTPASWYSSTIAKHAAPIIYIDFGQKWLLGEKDTAKLVEIAKIMMSAVQS